MLGLAAAAVVAPGLVVGHRDGQPTADLVDTIDARDDDDASRSGSRMSTAGSSQGSSSQGSPTPGSSSPSPSQPGETASPTPVPTPKRQAVPDEPAPRPAPKAAPASPTKAPTSEDAEIVALGNAARRAEGLADLTVSTCARAQAVARATRLADEGRFEHDPLDPIVKECGSGMVGENLALGYPTAKATVDAWLASPGHRANLLSPKYTSIGVACVPSDRGRLCAQVFLG